jgi:serine protease AprX
MSREGTSRGTERESVTWSGPEGTGSRGKSSRVVLATALALLTSVLAGATTTASASSGTGIAASPSGNGTAVVPSSLLAQATANPNQIFHVIVQGTKGNSSRTIAQDVTTQNGKLKRKFLSISGVAADLSGKDLVKLARHPHVRAITPDARVKAAGYQDAEMWRYSVDVAPLWGTPAVSCATNPLTGLQLDLSCVPSAAVPAPQAPAVALVDSGVDASKIGDFGSRVVASVNLSSLSPDTTADLEGHGTMVAGILAGASPLYPGVADNAPIVSLRTADANGESVVSDVIAAADWILANKDAYNIRVANFSMSGATATTFRFDPLDQAVERLWVSGIVVVAAAGNHGTGTGLVDMSFAPGNDPFVITVGATDQMQSADPLDDSVPWWSGYGYTMDGFSKPDMAAPGRYMIAPVPMGSMIPSTVPDRVVAPGYVWMSGTSFAAPVVSGAAAQILARHPDWGPNEVKGALMLTSNYLGNVDPQAAGVGEIDAATAASLDFTPPNPNENLDAFVTTDPLTGAPMFDEASWSSTVAVDASWSSASWSSASWSSASWNRASWSSASWNRASWTSDVSSAMASLASWSEASWSEASWSEASWAE